MGASRGAGTDDSLARPGQKRGHRPSSQHQPRHPPVLADARLDRCPKPPGPLAPPRREAETGSALPTANRSNPRVPGKIDCKSELAGRRGRNAVVKTGARTLEPILYDTG